MLRSNTKKARENVRAYILQDIDVLYDNYDYYPATEQEAIASMYGIFLDEMTYTLCRQKWVNEYEIFRSWAQGLALGGLFCYYYNRSAVDDLGDILEETEEERNKYSEQEAEEMLTRLIYREMRNSLPY